MKYIDATLILFVGMFLFTAGLNSQEIIGFEARFYLFAQEMWRYGVSWFPTTYSQPYPDYPATSTYFIYLVSHLFGHLNKLTAVLPSAIASAITLSVTYLIGAIQSRRWGWCAVFFLLFTLTFITEARTISLDQYIAMITVICFYLAIRNQNIAWFIPLFILGFAIRGPLGIVIPTGVLCVYYLLEKNIKRFFIVGFLATGLLVICGGILILLAHQVGGEHFVQAVLRMEVASRIHDSNMPSVSFYFTESMGGYAITYVLALLVLLGCGGASFRIIGKYFVWVLVLLIGLSLPADKKMRYILPMAPALALICAYLYSELKQNRYLFLLRKIMNGLFFIFPSLGLLVVLFLYFKNTPPGLNYIILIILFVSLQVLMFLFRKKEIVILGLAALTFFIANVAIVERINLYANRTREFVLQQELLRSVYHAPLVFFEEDVDGLPIKYVVNVPQEVFPVYLYHADDLIKLKSHTYVIIGKENFPHVPASILNHFYPPVAGKIGHDGVVVIERK